MSDDVNNITPPEAENTPPSEVEQEGVFAAEELAEGEREAGQLVANNSCLQEMMNRNFLEYASYVIKDRAIPDVDDGLKPVQRRILWAMHKVDDGRTHKAAFVVGEVMGKYHPHGDASIKDALVVLANKEYFIEKQGNFGNIITGSNAAAARYIECGLSDLAREVLFNDDITGFVDTYDGRNVEPVVLPVKIPALLMLGSDGIAVGMATKIMPHNFCELLNAQIACLDGEEFTLYPDFLQGGLMDVSEYADGNGKITIHAKIDIDGRRLVIREIPATTTTESLINSIEKAAERGKIKVAQVTDYTTKEVEIEVLPTRGYDPEKVRQALYMYTDCAVKISANLTLIRDHRPAVMSITEIIHRNTGKLLEYLEQELNIALNRQNELFHAKTLAQIFFENRIYKRIEECKSEEEEYAEVHAGLAPFRDMVRRDITDQDIDKLLALPVRRIARFDIEKNQRELREIGKRIAEIKRNLAHLKDYAKDYLRNLLEKYGHLHPRRTEIEKIEKIDRKMAALTNIKVGLDRKNQYLGTQVKSDEFVMVSEVDKILCLRRNGSYKVINIPDKILADKLMEVRRQDPDTEFGVIYRDNKSGKCYGKRTTIARFITDRDYMLIPEKCKIELLTPRSDAIYTVKFNGKKATIELNLMELPARSPKARGVIIPGDVAKITFLRYLTEEELAAARSSNATAEEATETDAVKPETPPATEIIDAEIVTEAETQEIEPTEVSEPVKPEKKAKGRKQKPDAPSEDTDTTVKTDAAAESTLVAEPVREPEAELADTPANEPEIEPEIEPVDKVIPASDPAPDTPAEQSPPPAEAPATEDAITLEPAVEKPKRRPRAKAVPTENPTPEPAPEVEKKNDDDSDEFGGIVQPEFGF